MRRNHGGNGLEVGVAYKPVLGPLEVAESVFESLGPIFLLVEALSDGDVIHSVVLYSENIILTTEWREIQGRVR